MVFVLPFNANGPIVMILLAGPVFGAIPWVIFGLPAIHWMIRHHGAGPLHLIAAAMLAVLLPFALLLLAGWSLSIREWTNYATMNLAFGLPFAALWGAIFSCIYSAIETRCAI